MVTDCIEQLRAVIADETAQAVPEAAQYWVEEFRQTEGVAAVLFYGSGLRQQQQNVEDVVFDFYLLVDGYRNFDPRWSLALAGSLVPPNVYYREKQFGELRLRCKFALLTVEQFIHAARGKSFTPHIWARFCQPARLPFASSDPLRDQLNTAMAESVIHFHRRTLHLIDSCQLEDFWRIGLQSTFADEIRSEKKGSVRSVVDANHEAYSTRTRLALGLCADAGTIDADETVTCHLSKFRKQAYRLGLIAKRPLTKSVVVARFIKAAFTFQGGLDYARWKIGRHSGVEIEITDFQRRHPLLGGLGLFWKVLRRGGLR